MSLLTRIAYSDYNPERAIIALRLLNAYLVRELHRYEAASEDDLDQKQTRMLRLRLNSAQKQENVS